MGFLLIKIELMLQSGTVKLSAYKGAIFEEINMLIQLSCINYHLEPDLFPIGVGWAQST